MFWVFGNVSIEDNFWDDKLNLELRRKYKSCRSKATIKCFFTYSLSVLHIKNLIVVVKKSHLYYQFFKNSCAS